MLELKKLHLNKYKKKENVYILGSGKSSTLIHQDNINRDTDWTIGFNFWIYHDFVPDFYFFEIKRSNIYLWNLFCELLKIKKKEYKNTIFIIKDLEIHDKNSKKYFDKIPESLRDNFHYVPDFHLGRGSNKRFDLTYFLYNKFTFLHNFYPKCRGTISECMYFAKKLSYKNIIIAGVDLTDSSFHLARDYPTQKYVLPKMIDSTKELLKNTRGPGYSHSSEDKLGGEPVISYVIEAFSQNFTKKDLKTYTLSKKSKLIEFLEAWEF